MLTCLKEREIDYIPMIITHNCPRSVYKQKIFLLNIESESTMQEK